MAVLTLELAAPLQAWGDSSRFTERQTRRLPTKSGVIGLIAAALGRDRDAAVDDLAALRFAARADKPGKVTQDFQTEIDWFYANKVGSTSKASRALTHRHYLVDAVFLVVLEGSREKLEEIRKALIKPVYPLFLGRRSCPPARRIAGEIIDDTLEKVIVSYPSVARPRTERNLDTSAPVGAIYARDARPGESADEICSDVPLSFADLNRRFATRGVVHGVTSDPHSTEGRKQSDTHDPFALLMAATVSADLPPSDVTEYSEVTDADDQIPSGAISREENS